MKSRTNLSCNLNGLKEYEHFLEIQISCEQVLHINRSTQLTTDYTNITLVKALSCLPRTKYHMYLFLIFSNLATQNIFVIKMSLFLLLLLKYVALKSKCIFLYPK